MVQTVGIIFCFSPILVTNHTVRSLFLLHHCAESGYNKHICIVRLLVTIHIRFQSKLAKETSKMLHYFNVFRFASFLFFLTFHSAMIFLGEFWIRYIFYHRGPSGH